MRRLLATLTLGFGLILGLGLVQAEADPAPEPLEPEPLGADQTILEVVEQDPQFSTLSEAIAAAGLAGMLAEEGPYTFFAPTDAAFNALPEAEREALLADPVALTDLLTYHLVVGEYGADELATLPAAPTVQGEEIGILAGENGDIMVEQAMVIESDLQADNGVIHVIDTVLTPALDTELDTEIETDPPMEIDPPDDEGEEDDGNGL